MRNPFRGFIDAIKGGPYQWYALGLAVMSIPLLIGVIFLILGLVLQGQAAKSSFVQAHGVRRAAVIVSVNNVAHVSTSNVGTGSGKHKVTKTTWTADVLASLAAPVDGQARTTVHVPYYETDQPGATLTVLVDPDDPGYAELPGSPGTSTLVATLFLVIGIVVSVGFVAGTVLIAFFWRRSYRRSLAS